MPEKLCQFSRLTFKKAIIDAMSDDDFLVIKTSSETYKMRRRDFLESFQNVIKSASYQNLGYYSYARAPLKAKRYLVGPRPKSDPSPKRGSPHQAPTSSNRMLSEDEREALFQPILRQVRLALIEKSGGDPALLWALRRKLYKELTYDERGKPMHRRKLKQAKFAAQMGSCPECKRPLPTKGSVLDRHAAMQGYTMDNTRLICPECDQAIQQSRGYS